MILQPLPISYDAASLTQNGVATPLMPAMSGYQRPYSTPVSATYPTAIQTSPWMHPQATTQYIVQPHMTPVIPSGIDPNALHFTSTLVPQLTAQMSQLQLQGPSVSHQPPPFSFNLKLPFLFGSIWLARPTTRVRPPRSTSPS